MLSNHFLVLDHLFNVDALCSERGIIGSLEKIYSKYVSKLESEDVHTSGCPLCHRTFNTNREVAALVAEVRCTHSVSNTSKKALSDL